MIGLLMITISYFLLFSFCLADKKKVHDHDHLTKQYRGSANKCNLNYHIMHYS